MRSIAARAAHASFLSQLLDISLDPVLRALAPIGHKREVDGPHEAAEVHEQRYPLHRNHLVTDEIHEGPVPQPGRPHPRQVRPYLPHPRPEREGARLDHPSREEDAREGRTEEYLPQRRLLEGGDQGGGGQNFENHAVPRVGGGSEEEESNEEGGEDAGEDEPAAALRFLHLVPFAELDQLGAPVRHAEDDPRRQRLGEDGTGRQLPRVEPARRT
mmetsp:Transcript_40108/g.85398  ORF Transcript_40108/g.85398 Transcript_40108/m.85398 type:complete len:215 (-) Transcript_40108:633-1277(-)